MMDSLMYCRSVLRETVDDFFFFQRSIDDFLVKLIEVFFLAFITKTTDKKVSFQHLMINDAVW